MSMIENKISTSKKIFFFLPLFVLTVSALANIIMAASVSDVGLRVHEYESKAARISAHSDELMTELAAKQSLTALKDWASANGFVPRGKIAVVESPKLASLGF